MAEGSTHPFLSPALVAWGPAALLYLERFQQIPGRWQVLGSGRSWLLAKASESPGDKRFGKRPLRPSRKGQGKRHLVCLANEEEKKSTL